MVLLTVVDMYVPAAAQKQIQQPLLALLVEERWWDSEDRPGRGGG